MTLNELRDAAHENAKAKGFYDDGSRPIPELLCLIHSEVSEALEDYRNGNMGLYIKTMEPHGRPVNFNSEMADILIRVFDLCGLLGIDLDEAVRVKMEYNATRPHRHGGKLA